MLIGVTGATGCLGMNLCQSLLQKGHHVIAVARNTKLGNILNSQGARFIECDLSKDDSLHSVFEGCDVVIHAAALSSHWGRASDFYQANVIATQNVINATAKETRLIHISSPSIYFDFNHRFSISEKEVVRKKRFANQYIKTKYYAEQLINKAMTDNGLKAITLRPRAIFGPYDRALLPKIINARGGVPLIGNGNNVIDITYVANVVHAIGLLLAGNEHCIGRAYNITNDEPLEYLTLVKMLLRELKKELVFNQLSYRKASCIGQLMEWVHSLPFITNEPLITRYVAGVLHFSQTLSIEAAKNDFGYQPQVSIGQGLKDYTLWLNQTVGNRYA